jgi:Ran-binding protein 9/10
MSRPAAGSASRPTAWDNTPAPNQLSQRSNRTSALQHLEVTEAGTRVRYIGPGDDDSQAATIRANHPVPASAGIYYFEIEVISKGRDGFISVGLIGENVVQNRLVGWEARSFGYHGDDGNAFEGSGKGKRYGPIFSAGDVIGVLYNQVARTISYYKNGVDIGVAFR